MVGKKSRAKGRWPIPTQHGYSKDPFGGVTVIYTTYGRPSQPAKVAPGEARTRAAPVEMCQMAACSAVCRAASRALPSAAYAAAARCRARSIRGGLDRHLDPPSWSLAGRHRARPRAAAARAPRRRGRARCLPHPPLRALLAVADALSAPAPSNNHYPPTTPTATLSTASAGARAADRMANLPLVCTACRPADQVSSWPARLEAPSLALTVCARSQAPALAAGAQSSDSLPARGLAMARAHASLVHGSGLVASVAACRALGLVVLVLALALAFLSATATAISARHRSHSRSRRQALSSVTLLTRAATLVPSCRCCPTPPSAR
eukprot:CAMPEP_0119168204 /NCGR_PEP_ID=MMETSP1315-20130426/7058_1 /TAXON_ID=676789 /ORGANISM="Prasinoderma singularis, Strain RCC927" /LENGTH=321 /DNA_ID=CAMNT_0007161693 /DNA_START=497 /DNA_END=1462 /DNA_ORIENTATION=+